ncbi:hypothetical protein ACWENQ_05055 [Nonomuraea sp. NPDC004354]
MNDQLSYLYTRAAHRDRVAAAERLAALRPWRAGRDGGLRHTLALGLHRLADSIEPSRPTGVHPAPSA